jgi:hypothetical protein
MKKTLVRYKVKAGLVEENERLVKEVYKQLEQENMIGFHYCTLKLPEGTFIHVAFSDTEADNERFTQLSAFKNFQAGIKERCEEFPVAQAASMVGSHDFFADALASRMD